MGPKIVAVVGARLNSSRLPRKQLLDLAGQPLIARVFERLSAVALIDEAVLATTADDYNADLVHWAQNNDIECYAHQGDVNDLMGRVDAVVSSHRADIILYVCGDSPLIEPTTISNLIDALLNDDEADWARLNELPEGAQYIHEGFSVYRRNFWNRMVLASKEAFEREHVGAVYHALSKVMPEKIAYVGDEPIFSTLSHRVSVDTPSDYTFMKRVYSEWYENNAQATLVDLRWVVEKLAQEPDLRAINDHVHQKVVAEVSKKVAILTQADTKTGLGHLRRMVVATKQLQDHMAAGVTLDIIGEEKWFDWLSILPHKWHSNSTPEAQLSRYRDDCIDTVVIDLPNLSSSLLDAVQELRANGMKIIIVDDVLHPDCFDAYYIPCFYVAEKYREKLDGKLSFGWDNYLLERPRSKEILRNDCRKLVVLTGGGDYYGLGQIWPKLLDQLLPEIVEITWILGPYASEPNIADVSSERVFNIVKNPANIITYISEHDFALTVYGISLFETLSIPMPSVVYVPEGAVDKNEVAALIGEGVCLVEADSLASVEAAAKLQSLSGVRKEIAAACQALYETSGDKPPLIKLVEKIG